MLMYNVFKMYVPCQDTTVRAGELQRRPLHARRHRPGGVDSVAAKDASRTLWVALINVDPNQAATSRRRCRDHGRHGAR